MTEPPFDLMPMAIDFLFENRQVGILVLDGNDIIIDRHGAMVDWAEIGLRSVDALPDLIDHADTLADVRAGRQPIAILPGIRHRVAATGLEQVYNVHGISTPKGAGILLILQNLAQSAGPERGGTADLADEANTAFLANVSHELRTPLNVIIGNAEILRDWDPARLPADDLHTFAEDILDNGTFLLDHINDLLDLAKAGSGGIDLVEEAVNMEAVVDDALAVVGRHADVRALTLQHQSEPGLPRLVGDPRRLQQAMVNLLDNAIRFTPDGGSISVRCFVDTNGRPTIEIADDGIGISAASLEHALQPFGLAGTPAVQGAQAGSGFGLTLAKTLIELHDGTLTLDSAPGKGTSATLRFPAERARSVT